MTSKKEPSLIAMVQDDDRLQAVAIQSGSDGPRILWARSSEPGITDWAAFGHACGLSVAQAQGQTPPTNEGLVVGLRPIGIGFYRLQLPHVPQSQLDSIVRMQVEARLPVSADQVELAWRQIGKAHEQVVVLVAATKRKYAEILINQVRPLSPKKIYLSSEGLVKAWDVIFEGPKDRPVVLISLARSSTQVCLVERGMLGDMAMIDLGLDQVVGPSEAVAASQQQFIQDLRSTLDSLPKVPEGHARPVCLISDGSDRIEQLNHLLADAGIEVAICAPRSDAIGLGLTLEELYEYRTAIGLALLADSHTHEGHADTALDLFTALYQPTDQQAQQEVVPTHIATGIAALALVAALLIAYATDIVLANRLKGLVDRHKLMELKAQLEARELVARYRPDILQLLSQINTAAPTGGFGPREPDPNGPGMDRRPRVGRSAIVLDSFSFKRGQQITVEGQVSSPEELYRFEEALRKEEGIRDVSTKRVGQDKQTNRIRFTMNFNYKNFTQKGAR